MQQQDTKAPALGTAVCHAYFLNKAAAQCPPHIFTFPFPRKNSVGGRLSFPAMSLWILSRHLCACVHQFINNVACKNRNRHRACSPPPSHVWLRWRPHHARKAVTATKLPQTKVKSSKRTQSVQVIQPSPVAQQGSARGPGLNLPTATVTSYFASGRLFYALFATTLHHFSLSRGW